MPRRKIYRAAASKAAGRVTVTDGPRRYQLLLNEHGRSDEGREGLKQALRDLGLVPTAEGEASMSARGILPGAEAGAGLAGPEVPHPLRPFIHSISVAPPHLYFDEGGGT